MASSSDRRPADGAVYCWSGFELRRPLDTGIAGRRRLAAQPSFSRQWQVGIKLFRLLVMHHSVVHRH